MPLPGNGLEARLTGGAILLKVVATCEVRQQERQLHNRASADVAAEQTTLRRCCTRVSDRRAPVGVQHDDDTARITSGRQHTTGSGAPLKPMSQT